VRFSEVEVKVRPTVRASDYPAEAVGQALPDVRCAVRIFAGPDGVPYDARVSECPDGFASHARDIALRYRFYPVKIDRVATPVQFNIHVNFQGSVSSRIEASYTSLAAAEAEAGIRSVRGDAVAVRHAPHASTPGDVGRMPPDDRVCRFHVAVDAQGRPSALTTLACWSAVDADARKLLWRYRFQPVHFDGVATPVAFDVAVDYGKNPPEVSFPGP
jgi:hypothetical protein